MSFRRGACLGRQGEASRGAYVLREGAAEAVVVLPGGDKLTVAKLGAGSVFGEMALLERALNAKVLEVPAPEDRPAAKAPEADPLARAKRLNKAAFDFRPFLPLLPLFEGFDEGEIAEVLDRSQLLELARGQAIFHPGQKSEAVLLVLRGAVEIIASHARRERRMAVLGPGQLLGYMSLLEGGAHGSAARVREQALLLETPRAAFEALYFGTGPASTKLHRAIQRSLLASLGQTNRHLTRLISLARLRGAEKEGDRLETALGGQIVSAQEG